ncbi:hypothetical protein JCM3766R1_003815 [Sporobolomyces carnicolor]
MIPPVILQVKHAFEHHRAWLLYALPSSLGIDYAGRKPGTLEESAHLDAANSASSDGTARDEGDEAQMQASDIARDDAVDAETEVGRDEETAA